MEELLVCPHCHNKTLQINRSCGLPCSSDAALLILTGKKPEHDPKSGRIQRGYAHPVEYKYILEIIEHSCSDRSCCKTTVRAYLCIVEGSFYRKISDNVIRKMKKNFMDGLLDQNEQLREFKLRDRSRFDCMANEIFNEMSRICFFQAVHFAWACKEIGGLMENNKESHPLSLLKTWNIYPSSSYKSFPDHVPAKIKKDYQEAHQIKEISPNASATLARRCLQGMIRDFWKIEENNLYQAIEALRKEDKVDEKTLKAIHAVRDLGNIGAHMEKDVNLIVNVDEGEADKLIWLIEFLIQHWYIEDHEKKEKLKEIGNLGKEKNENLSS